LQIIYISSNLATSATVYAMRISSGASTDAGGFGTLIGSGSEPNVWSKCASGHRRMGTYDSIRNCRVGYNLDF
jgi:hypothetical protein